jgi:hypothetical protein
LGGRRRSPLGELPDIALYKAAPRIGAAPLDGNAGGKEGEGR